jgi:hypothetical protein
MHDTGLEPRGQKIARYIVLLVGSLAIFLFTAWAFVALCFDVRRVWLRILAVAIFLLALLAVRLVVNRPWLRLAAYTGCSTVVLFWWLSISATNNPPWNPDLSKMASAEIHGDQVVVHNVRNCKYRSETNYSDCWSDRIYNLSQLRGVDFFLVNWGIKFASHPIISFDFGDQHLAFSIEARYRPGQSYSLVRGFFRQYGLIFVAAGEGDVIRLRTNYRKDVENVYLYRVQASPDVARGMFVSYLEYLNNLKANPEWYNQLTRNCTSTMDTRLAQATGNAQG